MNRIGILFVCTGNICRSPTAEGVFAKMVADAGLARAFEVDSAGTYDGHVGHPPDPRAIAAARRRGYDLSKLRARQLVAADFARFDRLVAMDNGHYTLLERMRPADARGAVERMLDYGANAALREVPDPYYGGPEGFERVLDLIEDAARAMLERLRTDA